MYLTQKNNFCLFERPFKIQKNGVFLFKISFVVLEILTFFILLQMKSGKNWINDISGNIKAVFLKLSTINVRHKKKKNKMTPSILLPWQQFATGAVLVKTDNPSFCHNKEPSTPHILFMGVTTTWQLCLFQAVPFVSLWRLQMGIFGFWTERDWSQKSCYGNNTKGVICYIKESHYI